MLHINLKIFKCQPSINKFEIIAIAFPSPLSTELEFKRLTSIRDKQVVLTHDYPVYLQIYGVNRSKDYILKDTFVFLATQ